MNAEKVVTPTAELIRLAQRELHGDSVLSDDAGFARLEARMAAPARGWSKRWLVGGVAVAALSGALAAALVLRAPPTHSLTFEVASGALSESGRIVATDHTRIRFSDGSEASLSNGTEAKIENVTEHGADMVLARGSMRVHIAKKPQASWKIVAGPYDVRVTGTAFDVSWSKQTQTFDIRMETGAVIVSGPLAQGGIPLKAGQHLFVGDGRLTVEGGETPSGALPAVASAEVAEESAELREGVAEAVPAPTPSLPGSATRANSDSRAWTRQVAEGHFSAVLEQAEQRGLSRTLSSGSLEELAALADAARYAGRSELAKGVLLAERKRFPGSGAAHDAAFFLGRIAEDSGGGVEWYERYVTESPRGAYASQAFGRKMMMLYKQRGAVAAQPAAADYLSRYPNGPYAAAARKLTQEASARHAP